MLIMHVVSFIVDAAQVGSRRHMHRERQGRQDVYELRTDASYVKSGVVMGDHDENHWGQQEE